MKKILGLVAVLGLGLTAVSFANENDYKVEYCFDWVDKITESYRVDNPENSLGKKDTICANILPFDVKVTEDSVLKADDGYIVFELPQEMDIHEVFIHTENDCHYNVSVRDAEDPLFSVHHLKIDYLTGWNYVKSINDIDYVKIENGDTDCSVMLDAVAYKLPEEK